MKKATFLFLISFSLIGCQSQKEKLEIRLKEEAIKSIKAQLKSVDSYKGVDFRIATDFKNDKKFYPFLIDSIYRVKGDSTSGGRYIVFHSYKAVNSFNALLDEMAAVYFDNNFKVLGVVNWTPNDEQDWMIKYKESGYPTDPLKK